MSHQQGEPSRDASALIDEWLAGAVHHDFESWNVPGVLQALEPRLCDAWEHGRDKERRTLLSLKEAPTKKPTRYTTVLSTFMIFALMSFPGNSAGISTTTQAQPIIDADQDSSNWHQAD